MAVKLDPTYSKAYNNLGVAYDFKNRIDEAIYQYKHAIEMKSDYGEAHYNLGIAYAKKGDMENAVYKLRKAIEINPDAHLALGIIYRAKLKKREPEGEISVYNRLTSGTN
jgi:tetratricopeptide (TPR) repeat protein